VKNQQQQEEQYLSLSTQAYKLLSEGKTPIEVAVGLNQESEITRFYKEYWKLNQLYDLNVIYEELKRQYYTFSRIIQVS